ncbi:methyltransferase domain containing protein [Nitzschia inconspicua]|uniref:Methyltransferase domain containing protein n=1 Tax=Nitzschia inconspicua TaxID=303405 RepID=A0A9K3KW14_9STRA|nr:methyltransferase domain containing protein [Nitzschia inconspicua]
MRDLAKQILNDNLKDDLSFPLVWIDERSRDNSFAVPEAPHYWQTPPKTLLTPVKTESDFKSASTVSVLDILHQNTPCTTGVGTIRVQACVQNRRRFKGNITVLVVEEDDTYVSPDRGIQPTKHNQRLECILHPSILKSSLDTVTYRNVAAVGSIVSLCGDLIYQQKDDPLTMGPSMWIREMKVVRAACQPSTIYTLIQMMKTGKVDLEEGADALCIPHSEITAIVTNMTKTEQQWKANQLALSLQSNKGSPEYTLSQQQRHVVRKYCHLLRKYPVVDVPQIDQPASLPSELDVLMDDKPTSRWETRKRPQIEWMCREISAVIEQHPDYGKRTLSILDIGGGKGNLAYHLSRTIDNIEITVVDIGAGAIKNGLKKGLRISRGKIKPPLSMVNFQFADASTSMLDGIEADVIISLHVCGHLTDVALFHAFHRNISFVIVPCCFKSNSHLKIPVDLSSGKGRPVNEWLEIPAEDWSQLKSIAEIQGNISVSNLGMRLICGIRANTIQRKLQAKRSVHCGDYASFLRISSFPVQYSTRNLAMIGYLNARSIGK